MAVQASGRPTRLTERTEGKNRKFRVATAAPFHLCPGKLAVVDAVVVLIEAEAISRRYFVPPWVSQVKWFNQRPGCQKLNSWSVFGVFPRVLQMVCRIEELIQSPGDLARGDGRKRGRGRGRAQTPTKCPVSSL